MNKKISILLILSAILLLSASFSSCSVINGLTNKTPSNFLEGIDFSKDYEDKVLEIYDDVIVFDEFIAFGEAIIICGSEDDFEDIVDFYKEFFKDNDIELTEEAEDRDEYYAIGVFDSYEFRVKIAEPDGEYVDDLFENIITLSTRELSEAEPTAIKADPDTTPSPTEELVEQTAPPAEEIIRPEDDENETRLTSLTNGSWSFDTYSTYDGWDWTIYIDSTSTGSMYYNDIISGDRWWDDITYEINDGILTFSFPNGDVYSYFAYYDFEVLHLIPTDLSGKEFYLTNYGQTTTSNSFDAFGDWMVYYAEDDFVGTISFWQNGTGYLYNGYENEEDFFFTWENIDGTIIYWDEAGSEFDSFNGIRKHNILEYHSHNSDNDPYFYNRTERNLLPGTYELVSSTEEGLTNWTMSLASDLTAYVYIQGSSGVYEEDYLSWYVDNDDGMLYIFLLDDYYGFYYHHFESGIKLVEAETGFYYELNLIEVG